MPLLIAGRNLIGNGIIAKVGLSKALSQSSDFSAIRRNSQNGPRRAPDGTSGLTRFANEEASILHDLEGGSEFPGFRGLVDLRAKKFMVISLPIAIAVVKAPESVAVKNEYFLVAQAQA